MPAFTPTMKARWTKAKTEFETITGKSKPREKVKGLFATSYTGLSKSLEACDKAADLTAATRQQIGSGKSTPEEAMKALTVYRTKHTDFQKSMTHYLQVLQVELKKEKDLEKDDKSIWERGLKFLTKELAGYDSVLEADIAKNEQALDQSKKNLSIEEKQRDVWAVNMKKALNTALAAAAQFKALSAAAAGKDAETVKKLVLAFNVAIPGGRGRDVVMQLVIAENVGGLNATPDAAKIRMDPWNTQNTHKLPLTASADDVAAKVKTFNQDVKFAKDWFENATR